MEKYLKIMLLTFVLYIIDTHVFAGSFLNKDGKPNQTQGGQSGESEQEQREEFLKKREEFLRSYGARLPRP